MLVDSLGCEALEGSISHIVALGTSIDTELFNGTPRLEHVFICLCKDYDMYVVELNRFNNGFTPNGTAQDADGTAKYAMTT